MDCSTSEGAERGALAVRRILFCHDIFATTSGWRVDGCEYAGVL
jgi:hypothetical protein